jgi:hypothetical protein
MNGTRLHADLNQLGLGIAACRRCGATFCPDVPRDRGLHAQYHRLVLAGEIPYTPPGQGPLRMLDTEIRKAHERRRKGPDA